VNSALAAARMFIDIYDSPASTRQIYESNAKRVASKAKKSGAQGLDGAKKISSTPNGTVASDQKDSDPLGHLIVASSDPLEEADKLIQPLLDCADDVLEVWIVTYDLAIRRDQLLLAIRALQKAKHMDPENPDLHIRTIEVHRRVSSLSSPTDPISEIIIESMRSIVPDEITVDLFNQLYSQRNSTNPLAIYAAAKVESNLDSSMSMDQSVVDRIFQPHITLDLKSAGVILRDLRKGHAKVAEQFCIACKGRFPISTEFNVPDNHPSANGVEATDDRTEYIF